MFTRSRNGRRGPSTRLNVERLEDRVLLHNTPVAAGLSAALAPAAVVRPSPEGQSHGHAAADSHAGDQSASTDAAKHADKGQGNGGASEGHGQGHSALTGDRGDDSASGKHGHGNRDEFSDDAQEKGSDSDDRGHGAAKKGQENSAEDDRARGHASFADSSSVKGQGAVLLADTGNDQVTTEGGEASSTTSGLSGEGSTGARPKAATVIAADTSPAAGPEEGGAAAPVQPTAAVSPAVAAPLPVPVREAALQDKADTSAAESVQTAAQAAGTAAVLALLAAQPASLASPSGQGAAAPAVGVPAPSFTVTGPAGAPLQHGGTLAEGPAPGGDAPADQFGPLPSVPAPLAGTPLARLAPDTRALDAALQGFWHGLDRLGESLAGPRSRLGVTAWVLTGLAALTALEWGRRRAAAAGADEVPLRWMDPGGPAL